MKTLAILAIAAALSLSACATLTPEQQAARDRRLDRAAGLAGQIASQVITSSLQHALEQNSDGFRK